MNELDESKIMWDPLVGAQLGETTDGEIFLLMNFTGDTGIEAHAAFKDITDVDAAIDVMTHLRTMMRTALDTSWQQSVELHGQPTPREIPDDLSSLERLLNTEEDNND